VIQNVLNRLVEKSVKGLKWRRCTVY